MPSLVVRAQSWENDRKGFFNVTSATFSIYKARIDVAPYSKFKADSLGSSYSGGYGIESVLGGYISNGFSL